MKVTFTDYEDQSTYKAIQALCSDLSEALCSDLSDIAKARVVPEEPTEVLSPHTDVVDFPTAKDIAREILDTPVIPIPPAPVAEVNNTAPVDSGEVADRDKAGDGVTWDARIHSGSKKMTAMGIWKRRKNIDDSLFESVMAELLGEVTTAAQVFDPAPVVDDPSAPPPAPVANGVDWGIVFQRASRAMSDGKLTLEKINSTCVELGVADFSALAGRSDVWDMFLIKLSL